MNANKPNHQIGFKGSCFGDRFANKIKLIAQGIMARKRFHAIKPLIFPQNNSIAAVIIFTP
jgi:hypothetical protein